MKRLFFTGLFLIAAYVMILAAKQEPRKAVAQVVPQHTEYPRATATMQPTRTPIPSATIGYEQTAMVAQATADEARRINAGATAEHESVLLAQSQLTAQSESNALVMLQLTAQWEGITATAAHTSIPLTATQQAANNTQAAARYTLESSQMTATRQAPTQIVAMERARNAARFGAWGSAASIFITFAFGVLALILAAYVVRRWRQAEPEEIEQPEPVREFVVNHVRRENGGYQQRRYDVPCTPEQLTWLAELAAGGEKRFSINRIEQMEGPLRNQRATLIAFRDFLTTNEFAVADGGGMIALNADGELFLYDWRKSQRLPDDYYFDAEDGGEGDSLPITTPPPLGEMQQL